MAFLDRTFCASLYCNNDCGHRMTDEQRSKLKYLNEKQGPIFVSWSFLCGYPQDNIDCIDDGI